MDTRILDDATLNKYSYTLNNSNTALDINGWQPMYVSDFKQTNTNFAAQLFKNADGTYKIAYRGTQSLVSSGDTVMNGGSIVANVWTQELTDSIKFTDIAIKQIAAAEGISYNQARERLSVTGHSQGGFEAELNAKFFGLAGTSLDGPGASAISQTSGFTQLKDELRADNPDLQIDYQIQDFVARRYTFLVGGVNTHVDNVNVDNSILSLTASAVTTLANPYVGIGVQGLLLHRIDNIIDIETMRTQNVFWEVLGVNDIPDIGIGMYPTYLASNGEVMLNTPDPEVMGTIDNFLGTVSGTVSGYVKNGMTYLETSDGSSLLIRKDGSGERFTVANDMIVQDVLGQNGVVTNRVSTSIVSGQTVTETMSFDPAKADLVRTSLVVQLLNDDNSVTRYIYDSNDSLVVTSTVKQMEDGSTEFVDEYPDGRVVTRQEDMVLSSQQAGKETIGTTISTYAPAIIDALSLIKAIQSGEPLPIVTSGLRLANDINNLTSSTPNYTLSGMSSVGGGILSIMSLDAALKQGDTVGAITASAQTISFAASAYASFTGATSGLSYEIGQELLGSGINHMGTNALGLTNGVLPYLNLANAIAKGDEVGIAISAVSLIPGMQWVGVAYAVYSIVDSLFGGDDIPDPWGTGRYVWNGTGITYQSAGETGGNEAVSGVMQSVITAMNSLIEQQRLTNPTSSLGIIANRMPTVAYDMSGYRYTDIDPLTGVELHPSLRFDTSGNPYNATPGSSESYQSIGEAIIRSALEREAIAPMWEVQTAKMQTDAGDPKAGLTEEARAGRDGQLAGAVTGDTQTFRPVTLDLSGNNQIDIISKATSGISFDVDDSGYMKETAWVGGGDAFLTLDRDYNGETNSGREMFSNSTVALGRRGLAGMGWVDANYDGKITSADPVWNELRVWQDANSDGVEAAAESMTLSELGITELNYAMGTFTQNGVKKLLSSPNLEADAHGVKVNVVPEGILIDSSKDGLSLLVTRIDDMTAVEANQDGISGYEDIEMIVSGDDLLANDTLGGFSGRDLELTGVSNFRHGSGFVDVNGFVHFTPEANYAGSDAEMGWVNNLIEKRRAV